MEDILKNNCMAHEVVTNHGTGFLLKTPNLNNINNITRDIRISLQLKIIPIKKRKSQGIEEI